jgi:hypothetical protein
MKNGLYARFLLPVHIAQPLNCYTVSKPVNCLDFCMAHAITKLMDAKIPK